MRANYLGFQAHLNVRLVSDLPDEVVRHALVKCVTANEHGDLRGVLREMERCLSGRVPGAHDEHAPVPHALCLRPTCPVEDARSSKRLHLGKYMASIPHTGRISSGSCY